MLACAGCFYRKNSHWIASSGLNPAIGNIGKPMKARVSIIDGSAAIQFHRRQRGGFVKPSRGLSPTDRSCIIGVPVHMIETINKQVRTSRQLVQQVGSEPRAEEIAHCLRKQLWKRCAKPRNSCISPITLCLIS